MGSWSPDRYSTARRVTGGHCWVTGSPLKARHVSRHHRKTSPYKCESAVRSAIDAYGQAKQHPHSVYSLLEQDAYFLTYASSTRIPDKSRYERLASFE